MAAALLPGERAALPVALRAVQNDLAVIDPDDEEADTALAAEVTRASVLLASHLDQDKRADWISAAVAELDGEPFGLVMEGIALARRSCKHPSEFVPAVIAYVAPRRARLEEQRQRLEEILKAAA